MNGDNHYQPGPDLPVPQPERFRAPLPEQPEQAPQGEEADLQPEFAPAPPSKAVPGPMPQTPFVPPPLPTAQPSPIQPPSPTSIPVTDAPASADDSDLIEKEWVNKAKHIVETSRDDPRRQNKEISKLKADYIQKRYNKQVKVSED